MRKLLKLWFALLSRVMPRAAERQAANIFLTPLRRTPRIPVVPNVPAKELSTAVGTKRLTGWSWGEGPTVLLVHGWSGRAADLSTIAEALVARGFRAVAYDLPAHGMSPGKRSSLGEWMHVLPALASEVGPVHAVVAHSLGAAGATLALEAGMEARGAVLIAPPLGPEHFIARVQRFIGLPSSRRKGMERELERLVGGPLHFFNSARAAATLSARSLIIHDPADDEVPFEHGEAIARAWRGSELVTVEGLGHYRLLRAPHVVERVVSFVAALDAPMPLPPRSSPRGRSRGSAARQGTRPTAS
jgi:pimeloyl-ACP methyl ester carboxylesterase